MGIFFACHDALDHLGNSEIRSGCHSRHYSAVRPPAAGHCFGWSRTAAGLVTHANFITLMPGTVSYGSTTPKRDYRTR